MTGSGGSGALIGLVSVAGALILVCGLAFILLKLVQKMPGGMGGGGAGSPVKFLRSLPVGQRERVTLVAYRGEVFMLGVTPGGISLLARMDEEASPEGGAEAGDPRLAERFKAAMTAARRPSAAAGADAARD